MRKLVILGAALALAAAAVGGEWIPGDCQDGVVNDSDLSLLLAHWGQDVTGEPDGGWGKGEFDGVAPAGDADLSLLLANWTGSRATDVPEPATLGLVVLAGVASFCRRRAGRY